ncbi:uncharacterized protein LOC125491183 isoform X1 [Plutella xylostella]|uniref:uncharacterized protein LOC125491183 isoform X1 n=1 Tax=Plutella xylostella TaxID=51655 RepID=UPI00203281BC|nr:uncharacterized protein LOC125491183 isoform X1 [Plutella xylostella]
MPYCTVCRSSIDRKKWIGHLRSTLHKNIAAISVCDGVEMINSAFKSRIATYRITATSEFEQNSVDNFFDSIRAKIKDLFDKCLQLHTCIKVNIELFSLFLMFKNDCQEIKSFGTKNQILYLNYDFDSKYLNLVNEVKKKIEEFQERDSGWTFLSNSHLEININKYQPLRGASYINLPKFIKNKKACLNIENNDPYCFLWSVVAALFPAQKHPERVSSYPDFRKVFNIEGMSFPVGFSDITIFEKNNPTIAVVVYGLKDGKTISGPLYRSETLTGKTVIHLLYIENDKTSHYCLIKNLTRLVRSQITKHHQKLHICESCLLFFSTPEQANTHLCSGVATEIPKEGSFLQFKNYERKQNMPFVIYADLETMLVKYEGCENDPNIASTSTLQRHVPIAFAYQIVCTLDDSYDKFVSYRGVDCIARFIECLNRDVRKIHKVLKKTIVFVIIAISPGNIAVQHIPIVIYSLNNLCSFP